MGRIVNFLDETTKILNRNGKTWNDVEWVSLDEMSVPVYIFRQIANEWYDREDGSIYVPETLMLGGEGFWMYRRRHDSREWWEYKTYPLPPAAGEIEITKDIFWKTKREYERKRELERRRRKYEYQVFGRKYKKGKGTYR